MILILGDSNRTPTDIIRAYTPIRYNHFRNKPRQPYNRIDTRPCAWSPPAYRWDVHRVISHTVVLRFHRLRFNPFRNMASATRTMDANRSQTADTSNNTRIADLPINAAYLPHSAILWFVTKGKTPQGFNIKLDSARILRIGTIQDPPNSQTSSQTSSQHA